MSEYECSKEGKQGQQDDLNAPLCTEQMLGASHWEDPEAIETAYESAPSRQEEGSAQGLDLQGAGGPNAMPYHLCDKHPESCDPDYLCPSRRIGTNVPFRDPYRMSHPEVCGGEHPTVRYGDYQTQQWAHANAFLKTFLTPQDVQRISKIEDQRERLEAIVEVLAPHIIHKTDGERSGTVVDHRMANGQRHDLPQPKMLSECHTSTKVIIEAARFFGIQAISGERLANHEYPVFPELGLAIYHGDDIECDGPLRGDCRNKGLIIISIDKLNRCSQLEDDFDLNEGGRLQREIESRLNGFSSISEKKSLLLDKMKNMNVFIRVKLVTDRDYYDLILEQKYSTFRVDPAMVKDFDINIADIYRLIPEDLIFNERDISKAVMDSDKYMLAHLIKMKDDFEDFIGDEYDLFINPSIHRTIVGGYPHDLEEMRLLWLSITFILARRQIIQKVE